MNKKAFRKTFSFMLSLAIVFSTLCFPQAFSTENIIYVSPTGSDSGNGSESMPYATLEEAFSTLGGDGTVVIMGALSKDKTILNATVTAKCRNASSITVTGKNPKNGVIYKDATLPV